MIQLIKKGGLRERANRSHQYQGSENTATTLKPNRYPKQSADKSQSEHSNNVIPQKQSKD
ncbi:MULTISPECIES: hypothetical protein [unclassified Acinetobacter]|uniref:hypothetical protein n=1 Tax=unclassified Acinetobacter TaxID=196816 RepID=UPI0029341033|nr:MULTISPECIES: hypothetical protein [unclassified Acinetobacter]WOE32078.1 hypothetical protein QSG84_02330 [Acinetobacter sp. SAAs470]WOE37547.1 hypothetical protein QSG86_11375 [Acinetobacter sp. SAAs474]